MHQLGKLTVLLTLPIKAVTSANATGAPGLRMYFWHTTSLGTIEYLDLLHPPNRTSLVMSRPTPVSVGLRSSH